MISLSSTPSCSLRTSFTRSKTSSRDAAMSPHSFAESAVDESARILPRRDPFAARRCRRAALDARRARRRARRGGSRSRSRAASELPCAITARRRAGRAGTRRRTCPGRAASAAGARPAGSAARRALPRGVAAISSRSASSTRPDRPLEQLQRDVAGEAVADDDVRRALEQRRGPRCCPRSRGRSRRAAACASSVSWFPFSGSSPIESSRTCGRGDVEDLLGEDAPMCANWSRCSGRASAFAPASMQHATGPRRAGSTTRDRRPDARRAAAARGAGRRRASRRCSRPRRRRRPRPSPTARTARDERAVGLRAHGLGRLLVHPDAPSVDRRARARACRGRAGPKRTGSIASAAPLERAGDDLLGRAVARRARRRRRGSASRRHLRSGSAERLDLAAPVRLQVGQTWCGRFGWPQFGQTFDARRLDPCCARRLSRRALRRLSASGRP